MLFESQHRKFHENTAVVKNVSLKIFVVRTL